MTKPPTCVMTVKLFMMELLTEEISGTMDGEEDILARVLSLSEEAAVIEFAVTCVVVN